ncbi:transposase [Nocardia sp. CDC160]|uniref:transposase n=1 Tax=Nocardia sp. CDC160 TaxID=3112166 RepID=UPI002DB70500|nr:transposase [Nocardia sp. CDC160]MEC3919152.1 transposase [Nocardia sp. CDC160]
MALIDRPAQRGRSCIMVDVATLAGDRYRVLTDKQWKLLMLLLPKSEGHVGRNFTNSRLVVEAMLYRLRAGLPWRDLPGHSGPWQTMWKRHRRYAADATWDWMLTAVLALADTMGNLDWVVSIDRAGPSARRRRGQRLGDRAMDRRTRSQPGRAADTRANQRFTDGASPRRRSTASQSGRGDRRPRLFRGVESNPVAPQSVQTVIPQRCGQVANRKPKGHAGGRAPSFDVWTYKRRNFIERAFCKAKHRRTVATRFDELAITYRAGFVLALIVEWLRSLRDTTKPSRPA